MTPKEYETKLFAMREANAIMGETIKSQEAEIERLKAELAQSVKLPLKVGDTAYFLDEYNMKVFENKVTDIHTIYAILWQDAIGITVFLTREEAEKELAERRGK